MTETKSLYRLKKSDRINPVIVLYQAGISISFDGQVFLNFRQTEGRQ